MEPEKTSTISTACFFWRRKASSSFQRRTTIFLDSCRTADFSEQKRKVLLENQFDIEVALVRIVSSVIAATSTNYPNLRCGNNKRDKHHCNSFSALPFLLSMSALASLIAMKRRNAQSFVTKWEGLIWDGG